MANLNYQNPNGMDPRGSWEPSNFLAGWNYTDRLNDYKNVRNITNQAGILANQSQAMQNQDFQANAPVRDIQRQSTLQTVGNQMQLAPLQQQTAMSNATVDANVAQNTMGVRASNAILDQTNKLSATKQQSVIQDNLAISKLVKGYGADPNSDPNIVWPMVKQQAKKMGIDLSDMDGVDSAKAVKFYQVMDDGHLKSQWDLLKQKQMDDAHMARTQTEQAGALARTKEITQTRRDVAGSKVTPSSLEAKATDIKSRMLSDPDSVGDEERAFASVWEENQKMKAASKADANASAAAGVPAAKVEALEKRSGAASKFSKDPAMKNYTSRWNAKRGKLEVYNGSIHIGDYE